MYAKGFKIVSLSVNNDDDYKLMFNLIFTKILEAEDHPSDTIVSCLFNDITWVSYKNIVITDNSGHIYQYKLQYDEDYQIIQCTSQIIHINQATLLSIQCQHDEILFIYNHEYDILYMYNINDLNECITSIKIIKDNTTNSNIAINNLSLTNMDHHGIAYLILSYSTITNTNGYDYEHGLIFIRVNIKSLKFQYISIVYLKQFFINFIISFYQHGNIGILAINNKDIAHYITSANDLYNKIHYKEEIISLQLANDEKEETVKTDKNDIKQSIKVVDKQPEQMNVNKIQTKTELAMKDFIQIVRAQHGKYQKVFTYIINTMNKFLPKTIDQIIQYHLNNNHQLLMSMIDNAITKAVNDSNDIEKLRPIIYSAFSNSFKELVPKFESATSTMFNQITKVTSNKINNIQQVATLSTTQQQQSQQVTNVQISKLTSMINSLSQQNTELIRTIRKIEHNQQRSYDEINILKKQLKNINKVNSKLLKQVSLNNSSSPIKKVSSSLTAEEEWQSLTLVQQVEIYLNHQRINDAFLCILKHGNMNILFNHICDKYDPAILFSISEDVIEKQSLAPTTVLSLIQQLGYTFNDEYFSLRITWLSEALVWIDHHQQEEIVQAMLEEIALQVLKNLEQCDEGKTSSSSYYSQRRMLIMLLKGSLG